MWAPTPLTAYQWISEWSAYTKPVGSGPTDSLTEQTRCQCCSVADSRVVCAKGKGRWSLPAPKHNPTAPISTEELPTAVVPLSWSPIITLVRRADAVREEFHHRSPLSHLSESPLSGLAAGYGAPSCSPAWEGTVSFLWIVFSSSVLLLLAPWLLPQHGSPGLVPLSGVPHLSPSAHKKVRQQIIP